MPGPNASPELFVAALLFSWLLPYRVLIVWVHDRTQSLLLVMLMHLPIVFDAIVFNADAVSGEQMFLSVLVNGAGYWLIVGAVALANGGHLTRPERARAAPKGLGA